MSYMRSMATGSLVGWVISCTVEARSRIIRSWCVPSASSITYEAVTGRNVRMPFMLLTLERADPSLSSPCGGARPELLDESGSLFGRARRLGSMRLGPRRWKRCAPPVATTGMDDWIESDVYGRPCDPPLEDEDKASSVIRASRRRSVSTHSLAMDDQSAIKNGVRCGRLVSRD